jgi:hypothetical protein
MRARALAGVSAFLAGARSSSPVTRVLLLLLMIYAACGLLLGLTANVASFFGIHFGDRMFAALFWGVFPAFLSAILIGRAEAKAATGPDIDHWGLLLAGCPVALKYAFWACFFYAWGLGMVLAIWQTHEPNLIWRGTSAICMAFYAMGLAASTAAYQRQGGFR